VEKAIFCRWQASVLLLVTQKRQLDGNLIGGNLLNLSQHTPWRRAHTCSSVCRFLIVWKQSGIALWSVQSRYPWVPQYWMPHRLFQNSRKLRTCRMKIKILSELRTKLTCVDHTSVGNPEQIISQKRISKKEEEIVVYCLVSSYGVPAMSPPPPPIVYVRKNAVAYLQIHICYCFGAHDSVVGFWTVLQAWRLQVQVPMRLLTFSIDLILPASLCHRVYSASHINECQKQNNNISRD
jgi:hypothetical protein